jgi:hypothetical protein
VLVHNISTAIDHHILHDILHHLDIMKSFLISAALLLPLAHAAGTTYGMSVLPLTTTANETSTGEGGTTVTMSGASEIPSSTLTSITTDGTGSSKLVFTMGSTSTTCKISSASSE